MRYVYIIENRIDHKVYVGQTKNPIGRRNGHFYSANHGVKSPFYHAIRKHGQENFEFRVIEETDVELVNDREVYWIAFYDSTNREKGYNLESGGGVGKEIHEETKKKLSLLFSGEKNPNYGVNVSVETRKKLSFARKGKKLSESYVAALTKAMRRIGGSFRGKKHSVKTRKQMGVSKRKITDEQVIEIKRAFFAGEKTRTELATQFNVTRSFVGNIIAGRRR